MTTIRPRLQFDTPRGAPWEARAACRFSAEAHDYAIDCPNNRHADEAAKAICAGCPVASQCLAANLDNPHGVWGGLNAEQRKTLRNRSAA